MGYLLQTNAPAAASQSQKSKNKSCGQFREISERCGPAVVLGVIMNIVEVERLGLLSGDEYR